MGNRSLYTSRKARGGHHHKFLSLAQMFAFYLWQIERESGSSYCSAVSYCVCLIQLSFCPPFTNSSCHSLSSNIYLTPLSLSLLLSLCLFCLHAHICFIHSLFMDSYFWARTSWSSPLVSSISQRLGGTTSECASFTPLPRYPFP